METGFSSALRLGGLDDFLEPAQECVLPALRVQSSTKDKALQPVRVTRGRVRRRSDYKSDEARATTEGNSLSPANAGAIKETGGSSRGGALGVTPPQSPQMQAREQGLRRVEKISLSDCLSCSGCLTSSEEILLQKHSATEFLEVLRRSGKMPPTVGKCIDTPKQEDSREEFNLHGDDCPIFRFVCVSLSSQSITAVAHHFGCSTREAAGRLSFLLRLLGADCVFSMGAAESVVISESLKEFLGRWLQSGGELRRSCGQTEQELNASTSALLPSTGPLPFLTSFCPGVAVLAAKQEELSLKPFLSRVRSAQQVQGLLVKSAVRLALEKLSFFLSYKLGASKCGARDNNISLLQNLLRRSSLNLDEASATDLTGGAISSKYGSLAPSEVFHVCVMPCFDKKLEAARPDFAHPHLQEQGTVDFNSGPAGCFWESSLAFGRESGSWLEVDMVLATSEIDALLAAAGCCFKDLKIAPLDCVLPGLALSLAAQSLYAMQDRHSELVIAEQAATAAALAAAHLPSGPSTALGDFSYFRDAWLLTRPSPILAGSGGYLELLFERAALCLFGRDVSVQDVDFKVGANEELQTLDLRRRPDDEAKMLSGAFAYGFRNIQNVSEKMRMLMQPSRHRKDAAPVSAMRDRQSDKNKWGIRKERRWSLPHLIEIAACPGGCLNGGGQRLSNATSIHAVPLSSATSISQQPEQAHGPKYLGRGREPLTSLTRIMHSEFALLKPEEHPLIPSIYLFVFGCCYSNQKYDSTIPGQLAQIQQHLSDKKLLQFLPSLARPLVPLGVWVAPAVTASFRSLEGAPPSRSKDGTAIRPTSLKW